MKYYTKCGRSFQKSTKAETTGYHLAEDDTGRILDQECAACPFPIDVKDGWPDRVHKRYECRAGSKAPNHENDWIGSLENKNTINILSLNHKFCEAVISFASEHPDLVASYTQDGADCRRHISVSCSCNKKGIGAKKELIEKFFPAKGERLDSDMESENQEKPYRPKCPFLGSCGENFVNCMAPNARLLNTVEFDSTRACRDKTADHCFDRFHECQDYRKYYADPATQDKKTCIQCCNNSWHTGLHKGYSGQEYCFCQKKQKPMKHWNPGCEWFNRHPDWPLENDNNLKEGENMSTINKDDLMNGFFGGAPSPSPFNQNKEEIVEIDLELIDDLWSFEHPFAKSLKRGKGIDELADQIRQCGVLQPAILRIHPDGRYETLAGHRRRRGATKAELTKIPSILKDCDDDTAKLIVSFTNLGQRDEILPSEKAKAYKMSLDAIKRVAGRPSKNGTTPLHNLYGCIEEENGTTPLHNFVKGEKSIKLIAEQAGESRETVRKYIRLNELIEPLLDRVDDGEISLSAAVEISYLKEHEQLSLENILSNKGIKLSAEHAEELRMASKDMELTETIIEAVINPPDSNDRKDKGFGPKPPKPVYKEVFKGLEKQFKNFPQERAEKLALVQKNELEEVITEAINRYLDTL